MGKLYSNEIRFSVFFSNNVHNFYFSPKRIKADTALEFLKIDKIARRCVLMEHKCYDEKSIWVYINYENATQVISFDPNYYIDITQIFIELGRSEYVRDHFNSIVSVEMYFPNGITLSQNKNKWEMTRKTKENLDKAVFQEYTKKDTIEQQWW